MDKAFVATRMPFGHSKLMAAYPDKRVFDRALSSAWADKRLSKACYNNCSKMVAIKMARFITRPIVIQPNTINVLCLIKLHPLIKTADSRRVVARAKRILISTSYD